MGAPERLVRMKATTDNRINIGAEVTAAQKLRRVRFCIVHRPYWENDNDEAAGSEGPAAIPTEATQTARQDIFFKLFTSTCFSIAIKDGG